MTPNSPVTSSSGSEVEKSMYMLPLHPSNNFNSYVSGEVTIDPSATIAPGVLILASPNSRIIIGAGVCIGLGSILHAHEGTLEVEQGANLGAGVLVIGKGKIGANACIGSTTTIISCSVGPGQVVAAGSIIGDDSRQTEANILEVSQGITTQPVGNPSSVDVSKSSVTDINQAPANLEPAQATTESSTTERAKVYGQEHLNRMLATMFPHRQALNRPLQDGQSSHNQT